MKKWLPLRRIYLGDLHCGSRRDGCRPRTREPSLVSRPHHGHHQLNVTRAWHRATSCATTSRSASNYRIRGAGFCRPPLFLKEIPPIRRAFLPLARLELINKTSYSAIVSAILFPFSTAQARDISAPKRGEGAGDGNFGGSGFQSAQESG